MTRMLRVAVLRVRIFFVMFALNYRRFLMYYHANLLAQHQVRARQLKAQLARVDCPRRALHVVVRGRLSSKS